MPRKDKTPWLEYTGQDTAEILAHKTTHRIDSLLCALEQEFYRTFEIEPKLFAFVEAHQNAFAIERMAVAPPPPRSAATTT